VREISVSYLVLKGVEDYLDGLIHADQLRLTRD
jgi:hypothetical protein